MKELKINTIEEIEKARKERENAVYTYREFSEMVGKTFSHISVNEHKDEMIFHGEESYKFYHEQDCCELIEIEDIDGDVDAKNFRLCTAEEVSRSSGGAGGLDSATWTFYRFRGPNFNLVVRWGGYSNGYYSESVDFEKIREIL